MNQIDPYMSLISILQIFATNYSFDLELESPDRSEELPMLRPLVKQGSMLQQYSSKSVPIRMSYQPYEDADEHNSETHLRFRFSPIKPEQMSLAAEFNSNSSIQIQLCEFFSNLRDFWKQQHYCQLVGQDIEILSDLKIEFNFSPQLDNLVQFHMQTLCRYLKFVFDSCFQSIKLIYDDIKSDERVRRTVQSMDLEFNNEFNSLKYLYSKLFFEVISTICFDF